LTGVSTRGIKPTGLIVDPRFEQHDTGPGHPERPARLARVRRALSEGGLVERCCVLPLVAAQDEQLWLVHDPDYVHRVAQACRTGQTVLDSMDTAICASSEEIARLAAGSVAAMSHAVARGELGRGFAAVRPPGHHAERDLAMGFCLFNNVAVAARCLTSHDEAERVLIVDWDVHHGNGTQHLFEQAADVFYFSCHQWPLYPGTGARHDRGRGAGQGTTLNCPLAPGAGDDVFLGALRDELLPAAERFRPDFVIVSAGFDAHRSDPLGGLEVSTEAYEAATRIVCDLADRLAGGRLVSVLEGGYDLDALADSVATHVRVLLGD
jgi:acetoin utilization deacetylase AcuC-like enzyme